MERLKQYIDHILPLEEESWLAFSTLFHETELKKGEHLSQEGIVATQFGLLLDGVGRSYYRNREGMEYNKHFFLSNQLIGAYSSLLSGHICRINVQALTDCRILLADFPSIVRLYDEHPKLERLFRLLAEHLYCVKEKKEIEMAMMNADERYHLFTKETPHIESLIPQYQIASYLGITPTQLSRIRARKSSLV